MSDFADYADRLNILEQIARIDRSLDEAAKFRAERAKLDAENTKLDAERTKLDAEGAKLLRDRFLAPALVLTATLGAIAALAPVVLRSVGARF